MQKGQEIGGRAISRKAIKLGCAVLVCLGVCGTSFGKYGGGSGTSTDPFKIATAQDLISLGNDPCNYDKHFVLTADIDLDPNLPGGRVFDRAVIAPDTDTFNEFPRFHGTTFSGQFDGQGYVIRNLHIRGKDFLGFVGSSDEGAVLTDIRLEAVVINGASDYGEYVGVLVGRNEGCITLSYCTGVVSGYIDVGGLAGINLGTIISSYSTSTVSGPNSSINTSGEIGGLVGENYGNILACYNHGDVKGGGHIGGLAGDNWGSITSSYSTGKVSGHVYVGGLVGEPPGSIIACFWDIQTSGQINSAGGRGLTTAQMKTISTFLAAGWDFVDETANGACQFWHMQEGNYPSLAVFSGIVPAKPEGSGTPVDPYRINDVNELGTLWYRPDADYQLVADINLADITWSAAVVPYFGGSLDSNGHIINSLRIKGAGYLGLFGVLGPDASLVNVALEDVDVNGNCDFVGGLAAKNFGHIISSYIAGVIRGEGRDVGGLVGINWGNIASSCSTGVVNGKTTGLGGLVGFNFGDVTTSYSKSMVSGSGYVGGLIGYNAGYLDSSYSMGAVNGERYVGGLVGSNSILTVINSCYSTGKVSGNYRVGGLAGLRRFAIDFDFFEV